MSIALQGKAMPLSGRECDSVTLLCKVVPNGGEYHTQIADGSYLFCVA
jgi:hypothetical protein